jgi:membrane protein
MNQLALKKSSRDFLNFSRFVALRFDEDRCMQVAASLSFTTLLSLVPLITIVLAIFSAFPISDIFSAQIKAYLINNLMPEMSGKIITQYMQQFTENAMRLTAFGIVFLAVTSMLMMLTIDHAFNTIWRVSRHRPLLKRLIIYWSVLTLAPLLVGASLSLTSWLAGLSLGYSKQIPPFVVSVLKMLPVLFTMLAFALLFRLVPNSYVPRKHAFIGAMVAAVVFEFMNYLFGYYISHFSTYKLVYGTFASVPIFLMWIYLSWLAILLGAVIAASLSHWGVSTAQNSSPAVQLLDALRLLKIMANGLEEGKLNTFPELSISLRLGYDALEEILDKLESANMIRKSEGSGWLLMRDVGHIRASELFRIFILEYDRFTIDRNDASLQQWFIDCIWQLEQNTDLTLQELFARNAIQNVHL